MDVHRYRKLPVVVDAVQLTQDNAVELARWCGAEQTFERLDDDNDRWLGLTITTLEGRMVCSPGDYLIRGVEGEFYPCKETVFDTCYEPV